MSSLQSNDKTTLLCSSLDERSPEDWAAELGHTDPRTDYDWMHTAASNGHGWKRHEYHAGEPILLACKDYEAALEAAAQGKFHKPAMGKY